MCIYMCVCAVWCLQYGFVAMSSEAEMEKCLSLDKTLILHDKKLRLARTRRNCSLVISNLASSVTAEQLAAVFRQYGSLHEGDTYVGLRLAGGVLASEDIDKDSGSGNTAAGNGSDNGDGSGNGGNGGGFSGGGGGKMRGSGFQVGVVHFQARACAVAAKRHLHGQALGTAGMFVDWAPPSASPSRPVSVGTAGGNSATSSLPLSAEEEGEKEEEKGNGLSSEASQHQQGSATATATASSSSADTTTDENAPKAATAAATATTSHHPRSQHKPKYHQQQRQHQHMPASYNGKDGGQDILSLYVRFNTLEVVVLSVLYCTLHSHHHSIPLLVLLSVLLLYLYFYCCD
jgi:hypothetical protein